LDEQVYWTKTLADVRVGSADQVRAELKKSRTRLNWRVQFAPEALDQLRRLKKHFANAGAPMTAERYVDSIVDFCTKLQTFPARGSHVTICCHRTSRVPHFRKRAIFAYLLEAEAVAIGNVFYGDQDYEATLARDEDQQSTLIGGDDSCRSERNHR
jgi:plasmid stabilization system protein ParE